MQKKKTRIKRLEGKMPGTGIYQGNFRSQQKIQDLGKLGYQE